MPTKELKLRADQREELKRPLGILIPGCGDAVWGKVLGLIRDARPKKVIAVGDETLRLFMDRGMPADLSIIDGSVRRVKPAREVVFTRKALRLSNPAGSISGEAWGVVRHGLTIDGGAVIKVDGEEDLLTLVAILEAPTGSMIFYGQPGEGLVAVIVTGPKKDEIRKFVEGMERAEGLEDPAEDNVFQEASKL